MKYDGNLQALVEQTAPYKLLRLTLQQPVDAVDLDPLGEVETINGLEATLRVPRGSTKQVAAEALARLPVADIMIEEPPVEEIIREVFRQEAVHG
jgi:ABC-2 type transport system ATP-binding protein